MEFLLLLMSIAIAAYFLLRRKSAGVQQVPTDHLPETFIVLDLETTGLDAARHEIIEIAAIRYRKGTTTHETLQALVKPSKKVPKKITEITGITQEMLDTKPVLRSDTSAGALSSSSSQTQILVFLHNFGHFRPFQTRKFNCACHRTLRTKGTWIELNEDSAPARTHSPHRASISILRDRRRARRWPYSSRSGTISS